MSSASSLPPPARLIEGAAQVARPGISVATRWPRGRLSHGRPSRPGTAGVGPLASSRAALWRDHRGPGDGRVHRCVSAGHRVPREQQQGHGQRRHDDGRAQRVGQQREALLVRLQLPLQRASWSFTKPLRRRLRISVGPSGRTPMIPASGVANRRRAPRRARGRPDPGSCRALRARLSPRGRTASAAAQRGARAARRLAAPGRAPGARGNRARPTSTQASAGAG